MPSFVASESENYTYIRTMHQQNRIVPVAGDMLADNGLRSIGDATKKMNIPIRIFYTSNAPTAGDKSRKSTKKMLSTSPLIKELGANHLQ